MVEGNHCLHSKNTKFLAKAKDDEPNNFPIFTINMKTNLVSERETG